MAVSKGAVLSTSFIEALGLGVHVATLTGPILNKAHPDLLEPMFFIEAEEYDDTVYLERNYLYDAQLSIKSSYGAGERVLMWMGRGTRYRNGDNSTEPFNLLLASDLFLFNDPHEFIRFRTFLKSQRIIDAQARDFLAKNHKNFGELATDEKTIGSVLACLGNIREWPDPENGFQLRKGDEHTLEGLAKGYSVAFVAVRNSPILPRRLLAMAPEERLSIFRLFCFAEDAEKGPEGLRFFLATLGRQTGNHAVMSATSEIHNGQDFMRALEIMRRYLLKVV